MKPDTTQAANPNHMNQAAISQQTRSSEQAPPCTPMSFKESARLIAMIAANHVLETRGSRSGFEFDDHEGSARKSAGDVVRLAASMPNNRCIDIQGKLISSIDLLRTAEHLYPSTPFTAPKTDPNSSGLSKSV